MNIVAMQALILGQVLSLARAQWSEYDAISSRQSSQLLKSLHYALTRVQHYRDSGLSVADIHSVEDLARFPILDKRAIQQAGSSLIADGYDVSRMHWSRTSGSTGEPTVTYFDDRTWALCKYSLKIRRMLAMTSPWFRRVLLVSEQPPDAARDHARSRAFRFAAPHRECTVSLFEDMAHHRRVIADFRPDVIYAFPSYFMELIVSYEREGVVAPRVPWLCTSSELLRPLARQRIERAFRGRVFDIYGCTEFKEVAWQCRDGSYHINVESVFVETVPDGRGDGAGRVLLTTLVNRAMPLVRFATGDRGELIQGICCCGRALPRLRLAEGREGEMIDLPNGHRVSPYLLTTLVESLPGLRQYRIVHESPDRLRIELITAAPVDRSLFDECRLAIRMVLQESMHVDFQQVQQFPRGQGGKQSVYSRAW